jgi:hypothetical protein
MTSRSTDRPRLSWAEACARRLQRHALSAPLADAGPAQVVAAICGAHAQVMTAAEWSIGLRLVGLTRSDILAAVWTERVLVKTFGPRGTVHLLPARDLPMWTAALSAVPSAPNGLPDGVRLTPDQTEAVIEAIAGALLGAELTVAELTEEVVGRTGAWAGELVMPAFGGMWPRWRQAMPLAGFRGALCFGPIRGRSVTYTSPRRWLPGFCPAEPRPALAGVVRRYLDAYGPATPEQFARWLGAPRRWAVELFGSLGSDLRQVELDGMPAWLAAGDTAAGPASPAGMRLLPYFDAYLVGCQPRHLVFPGRAGERALSPTGQAGNFPVLLIDGVAGGVWHQRCSGRRLHVTVEPFGRLSARRRGELDAQVQRLGEFLAATPQLTIGPVKSGAHA